VEEALPLGVGLRREPFLLGCGLQADRLPARVGHRQRPLPLVRALGHLGDGQPDRLRGARVQPRCDRGPERRRAPLRHGVRGRGGRARRLLPDAGVAVTSALIVLPLAGALVLAILPLPRRLTEGLALLVALAECAVGAAALIG